MKGSDIIDKDKIEDFREQVKNHAFYKTRPKLRRIILELLKHINTLEDKISKLKQERK